MAKIELNFDPQELRALVDREPWEPAETGRERRYVGLGSVMALTPSGKCYAPFATGNLHDCPVCDGTGVVRVRGKARVVRKTLRRNRRKRRLWVKRYGPVYRWPTRVLVASDHLNRLAARHRDTCPRCGGLGAHEAWDDERWNEAATAALDAVGLCLETSEGDGAYLVVTEYRDTPEKEPADDEGPRAAG